MEVLILGICHEIFFFGKKRSKIRVRIIHRHALYTGKYGIFKIQTTLEFRFWEVGIWIVYQSVGKSVMQSHTNINSCVCLSCLTLKLTQVTKTDFLLTVPIKYQTSKWWD